MRIADIVFRQGHLSENALTQAVVTGDRPDHLDGCELCTRRALDLSRWLDDARAVALDAADEAFPPERLALQQTQILRRLEQLDEPARVIAFPAHAVAAPRSDQGRRVAPAWLGVAAAAGLVVGVIGSQLSAGILSPEPQPAVATPTLAAPVSTEPLNASLLSLDLERYTPTDLRAIEQATPTMVAAQAQ